MENIQCVHPAFSPFVTAVIMTPTRELALQITKECKKFSKPLGLRVVCVYGGTGISEQVNTLTHVDCFMFSPPQKYFKVCSCQAEVDIEYKT